MQLYDHSTYRLLQLVFQFLYHNSDKIRAKECFMVDKWEETSERTIKVQLFAVS